MENPESKRISLTVLGEKRKNRVVFAEAGKDFVDVLLSFLTMPMSTIINLTREFLPEGVGMGCLTNLYDSIQGLDDQHFQTLKCKEMLLQSRSALEMYCKDLEINLIQSEASDYYACKSYCEFLSYYLTHNCRCGKPLGLIVTLSGSAPQEAKGFLKPTARLMISDDFQLVPMSSLTAVTLLDKRGALGTSKIGEMCFKIGRDEIVNLLIGSITSRTPFSNTLMETTMDNHIVSRVKYGPRSNDEFHKVDTSNREKISLKLIVNKSKALYAEVKEDFLDLLFGFLTIPLGYVFKEFPHLSFEGCLGNLYKSTKDLDVDEFFLSDEKKKMIINPKLAPGLSHSKQLIGIEEAINPSYSTLTSLFTAENQDLGVQPDKEGAKPGEGFIKGPRKFMVTDDLTVTPLSVISGLLLIKRLKIPLAAIEEKEVTVGEDEALRLLLASFASKNALTHTFFLKEPKQEN